MKEEKVFKKMELADFKESQDIQVRIKTKTGQLSFAVPSSTTLEQLRECFGAITVEIITQR